MENTFSLLDDKSVTLQTLPNYLIKPNRFFNNTGGNTYLLPLPGNFWDGSFIRSGFYNSATDITLIPDVDPIISDYGREQLRYRFTAEFIRFVNARYRLFNFFFNNKIEFAKKIYELFYGGAVSIFVEEQVDKTLTYYFSSFTDLSTPIFFSADNKPFIVRLRQVINPKTNPKSKLTQAEAQGFIKAADDKINEHLKKFFSDANLAELQRKPDKNEETNENPYYTIDAGIILEADAIAVLDKIGPLYFAKTGEKFNVNSGTRDSFRQADAMYNVYIEGDKTFSLYRNRTAANELVAIIENGKKTGKSKEAIIQTMTDLIQKYFEKGDLMSSHQKAGAIDISIKGDVGVPPMKDFQQKIMMEIALKVTGFAALREKHPPHIHIKFK